MRTLILGLIVAALSWAPPAAAQGISSTTQEFNVEAGTQYRLTWPDTRAVGVLRSDADGQLTLTGIAGTDITSGLVPPARLGAGSPSSTTFLRGDGQWQTVTQGTTGVTSLTAAAPFSVSSMTGDVTLTLSLAATDIPDLGAAKITSGTFTAARIPVLGTANVGDLAATDITSGTFTAARIPNLPASQITSGEFLAARIPTLGPTKITPSSTNGQVLMTVGGATTWTFPFEFPTTVSGRELAVTSGGFHTILSATIQSTTNSVTAAATARVTQAGTGSCNIYFRGGGNPTSFGLLTITSAPGSITRMDLGGSGTVFPGNSVSVGLFIERFGGASCTVDSGATLTLTTS